MRLKFTITLVGVLLAMAACRGSGPPLEDSALRITALYGSDSSSIGIQTAGDVITLHSPDVAESGLFLLLESAGVSALELVSGNANSNLLFMEVATSQGTELGAVPIDPAGSRELTVSFRTGAPVPLRRASLFEDPYRVDEIVVVPSPLDNYVSLNWVEKNIGDYDFNGEVNAADLIPLSLNLGQSGFRNSAAANATPLFYIDGDENNEINLADIVPIARYFHNSIRGYFIYKNDEAVTLEGESTPAFFSRDPENEWIINDAPVFFQVSVEGSFEDQYKLLPVDAHDTPQSQSVVFDGVELQAVLTPHPALLDDPPTLFDLSGNGVTILDETEENSPGYFCVMRVIEPGDIVNGIGDPPDMLDPAFWNRVPQSADEGAREGGAGYRFDKLTRPDISAGHALPYLLEILVAPTVDLRTGAARSYIGSKVPNSFYYRLAVPVFIPPGHRSLQAELVLDIVPAAEGPGYDVVMYNHQFENGDEFDNSVIKLAFSPDDPDSGIVCRVFDPAPGKRYLASDFQYSPKFTDYNADGISDQLQRRMISLADGQYYSLEPFPLRLRGEPLTYDPLAGTLDLLYVDKILDSGLEVFYAGQARMQLSEMSRLTWIIHDDAGDHLVQVDPSLLQGLSSNATVLLDVSLHDGPSLTSTGLKPLYWVDQQTITLDLTSTK